MIFYKLNPWKLIRSCTAAMLIGAGSWPLPILAEDLDCGALLKDSEVTEICGVDVIMEKSHLETGKPLAKCHRDFNTKETPVRTLMFRIMEKKNPSTAAKLFKFQRAAAEDKEQFVDLDFADTAYRHKDLLVGDAYHFVHFLKGKHQVIVRVAIEEPGSICTLEQATELAKIIAARLP